MLMLFGYFIGENKELFAQYKYHFTFFSLLLVIVLVYVKIKIVRYFQKDINI